jgi:hypothetical protein
LQGRGIYPYPQVAEVLVIKAHRVWIEIVLLGAAIACALALLIATLGAAAGAAVDGLAVQQQTPIPNESAPPETPTSEHTYEGMVTCSRCKAKHSAAMGRAADVCVRVCVHGGAQFALVNADSFYLLDGNLGALKKVAGERVRLVGNLTGNTIRVQSVNTLS